MKQDASAAWGMLTNGAHEALIVDLFMRVQAGNLVLFNPLTAWYVNITALPPSLSFQWWGGYPELKAF